jgi:hypothetical protein
MNKKLIGFALAIFIATSLFAQRNKTVDNRLTVTAVNLSPVKQSRKKIEKEIQTSNSPHIFITNNNRDIEIKTWNENKVKVDVTANYDSATNPTDNELWKKSNIDISGSGDLINIISGAADATDVYSIISPGSINTINSSDSNSNRAIGITGSGNSSGHAYTIGVANNRLEEIQSETKDKKSRPVIHVVKVGKTFTITGLGLVQPHSAKEKAILYIPQNATIKIKSQYGNIIISSNVADINLDITNANVYAADAGNVKLDSKLSNIDFGNINRADIKLEQGRFSAKNINDLHIDSKSASVEVDSVKTITLQSDNDDYDIQAVDELNGKKDFGNLTIGSLGINFDLQGTNADIKLRNVVTTCEFINIEDQFADLRLSIKNLKNAALDFDGKYSTVYTLADKVPVIDITTKNNSTSEENPIRFKSKIGNIKDKHTVLQIKCPNCIVDLR